MLWNRKPGVLSSTLTTILTTRSSPQSFVANMTRKWMSSCFWSCLDSLQILYFKRHDRVGGNQREMDRAKAAKKAAAQAKKPKESATTLQQRREK